MPVKFPQTEKEKGAMDRHRQVYIHSFIPSLFVSMISRTLCHVNILFLWPVLSVYTANIRLSRGYFLKKNPVKENREQ